MSSYIEFYVSDELRKQTIVNLKCIFTHHNICRNVELGCYTMAMEYSNSQDKNAVSNGIYKEIVSNLMYNLKNPGKTLFKVIDNLNQGNYSEHEIYHPKNLAYLSPEQFNPEHWEQIITKQKLAFEKLTNLPTITRSRPCKCGANKFFFCQLQTRSADEPITTYYTCKSCNKTYAENR